MSPHFFSFLSTSKDAENHVKMSGELQCISSCYGPVCDLAPSDPSRGFAPGRGSRPQQLSAPSGSVKENFPIAELHWL